MSLARSNTRAGGLAGWDWSSVRGCAARPPAHATIGRDVHCAACWYNLRGLGYQGRCPECGTRYDAARNIRKDDAKATSRARRRRYIKTITNIAPSKEQVAAAWMMAVGMWVTGAGLAAGAVWAVRWWWVSW